MKQLLQKQAYRKQWQTNPDPQIVKQTLQCPLNYNSPAYSVTHDSSRTGVNTTAIVLKEVCYSICDHKEGVKTQRASVPSDPPPPLPGHSQLPVNLWQKCLF